MSPQTLHHAWLLTGSNLGNRAAALQDAREWMTADGLRICKASGLYETAAWGKTDLPAYLNQALEIETNLNAKQLIRHLLRIEKKMGRVRTEKYASRIIDIDILLFEDAVIDFAFLQLPHPELHNRRFALTPLAEIAPDFVHPVLHKNIARLLEECPDPLPVQKLS